jgi:hypothetical protein
MLFRSRGVVINSLLSSRGMAYFFPTWAIVPSVDVIDIAFREEVSICLLFSPYPYFYMFLLLSLNN